MKDFHAAIDAICQASDIEVQHYCHAADGAKLCQTIARLKTIFDNLHQSRLVLAELPTSSPAEPPTSSPADLPTSSSADPLTPSPADPLTPSPADPLTPISGKPLTPSPRNLAIPRAEKLSSMLLTKLDKLKKFFSQPVPDAVGRLAWEREDFRIVDIRLADPARERGIHCDFRRALGERSLAKDFDTWSSPSQLQAMIRNKSFMLDKSRARGNRARSVTAFLHANFPESSHGVARRAIAHGLKILSMQHCLGVGILGPLSVAHTPLSILGYEECLGILKAEQLQPVRDFASKYSDWTKQAQDQYDQQCRSFRDCESEVPINLGANTGAQRRKHQDMHDQPQSLHSQNNSKKQKTQHIASTGASGTERGCSKTAVKASCARQDQEGISRITYATGYSHEANVDVCDTFVPATAAGGKTVNSQRHDGLLDTYYCTPPICTVAESLPFEIYEAPRPSPPMELDFDFYMNPQQATLQDFSSSIGGESNSLSIAGQFHEMSNSGGPFHGVTIGGPHLSACGVAVDA